MRFVPPTIIQKGLRNHLTGLGVNYTRINRYFENGATDTFIKKKTGHDRHTIARWRRVWDKEQKIREANRAVDRLSNV